MTKRVEKNRSPSVQRSIVETYLKTKSISETSRILNIPKTTCYDIMNKWKKKNPTEFEKIRTEKDQEINDEVEEIMNKVRKKIIDKLDDVNDNSTIAQLTTTYGILYDKKALSEGRSTTSASINVVLSPEIQDLSK